MKRWMRSVTASEISSELSIFIDICSNYFNNIVIEEGFDIRQAKAGGRFGAGFYFAENCKCFGVLVQLTFSFQVISVLGEQWYYVAMSGCDGKTSHAAGRQVFQVASFGLPFCGRNEPGLSKRVHGVLPRTNLCGVFD